MLNGQHKKVYNAGLIEFGHVLRMLIVVCVVKEYHYYVARGKKRIYSRSLSTLMKEKAFVCI
jgi:hypothetical protein